MKKGKIFTFYSYKGGTGRSMAIVNLAVLLSNETTIKVLIIDWDLEAPGLHRYLQPHCSKLQKEDLTNFPGLIDYFIEVERKCEEVETTCLTAVQTSSIIKSISINDFIIETDIPGLHFMKAGDFNKDYSKKINEFKWEKLFRKAPGIYKKFADEIAVDYDFILIDSRTGLTDTSGICTMILPEKLILVFTPNHQSLEGVTDLGKRAAKYRLSSSDVRPLKLYPLPSRIETGEKDLREQWRRGSIMKSIEGYQTIFEALFEEVYKLKNIDFTSYFDEVQIQHEPRFSYGEEIAVMNKNQPDRLSMAKSYSTFLNKILLDDVIWEYKKFPNNHNLPNRIEPIGRQQEIDELMIAIDSRYPIISVHGAAGVGKTILALETGYQCLMKPLNNNARIINFQYVVWISSKNKLDKRRDLNDLLNTIASVLGFLSITQLGSAETVMSQKQEAIENLLKTYKVLIIINNLELNHEDKILIKWLKLIPEPSKILITTRMDHSDIPSWKLNLLGLNIREQKHLINKYLSSWEVSKEYLGNKKMNELFQLSNGNPKILEIVIGMLKTNKIQEILNDEVLTTIKESNTDEILHTLHKEIWNYLQEDAQGILKITPLFVGTLLIPKRALRGITGFEVRRFENAMQQLLDMNLVIMHQEERYFVHPITREYSRSKLEQDPSSEMNVRRSWSNYYLTYVHETIVRDTPDVVYWNVLVSDKMMEIDNEWKSIYEVLKWAFDKDHEVLLKLVLLLVHYMDSRFYNQERLMFVKKAIQIAARKSKCKYEEALLRIDALGWTYVEENRMNEATDEINEGLRALLQSDTVPNDKINDLSALANAWMARSALEAGEKLEVVEELISKALKYEGHAPWIYFRIRMAAGDIEMKKNEFVKAAENYARAKEYQDKYGMEGHSYQINPRIGIACLKNGNLSEAERKFKDLLKLVTIPIGQLYGQYGLALIKLIKGDVDGARKSLRSVKEELNRRTGSHILQKLIEDIEVDILKNLSSYQNALSE